MPHEVLVRVRPAVLMQNRNHRMRDRTCQLFQFQTVMCACARPFLSGPRQHVAVRQIPLAARKQHRKHQGALLLRRPLRPALPSCGLAGTTDEGRELQERHMSVANVLALAQRHRSRCCAAAAIHRECSNPQTNTPHNDLGRQRQDRVAAAARIARLFLEARLMDNRRRGQEKQLKF